MENLETIDSNLKDGITLTEGCRESLKTSGTWARVIAVMSFAIVALALINMLVVYSNVSKISSINVAPMVVAFIIAIALTIYPLIALFGFNKKIKLSFETNDQMQFQSALKDLKGFFVYSGVLILISGILSLIGMLDSLSKIS